MLSLSVRLPSKFMHWQVLESVFDCVYIKCVCVHVFAYYHIVWKFRLVQIFTTFVDRPVIAKINELVFQSKSVNFQNRHWKACYSSKTVCYAHDLLLLVKRKWFVCFSTHVALEKPDKCMATFEGLAMCFDTKIPPSLNLKGLRVEICSVTSAGYCQQTLQV